MTMLASSLAIMIPYFALSAPDCPQCKEEKCDEYKNCLKGCIPGFAGRKCLQKCPTYCIESLCDYEEKHGNYPCTIGCKPGYHGLQCKTPCQTFDEDGKCDRFSGTAPDCQGIKYGQKCETSCQPECGGSVCDNKGNCYKTVCIPGRCGSDCKGYCPANELCHKDSEECQRPDEDKDELKNSKCSCDQKGTTGEKAGYTDVLTVVNAVCSVTLIIILIALFVSLLLITRKFMRQAVLRYTEDEAVIVYRGEDLLPNLRDDENLSCKKKRRSGNQ